MHRELKKIHNAHKNLCEVRDIMLSLGDFKKAYKLTAAANQLENYIRCAECFFQASEAEPSAEREELYEECVDDLRAIADFYRREAEKNLRLLNEARGVVWHSVEEELPSENGTYLVVGKSGTVCTAHFYPEHKIPSTEYAIIPGHFSNRHVRFWAKLPEPPIPDQDYQHADNK